jgi:predicted permease
MKGTQGARGSRTHRLRGALVSAQVAAGIVLLMGTGLFLRALTRALAIDPGFRVEDVAMIQVDPGLAQLDAASAHAYYADVLARVGALPGIVDATWASAPPLTTGFDRMTVQIEGYVASEGERVALEFAAVGPHYHRVLDIPFVAGRGFENTDDASGPPVVVLNETAAKRYFAGRDAVGAQVTMGGGGPATVIGVARAIRYHALSEEPRPYAWLALRQLTARGGIGAPALMVRTTGTAATRLPAIVGVARSVDARVPDARTTTLKAHLNGVLAPQLAGVWLLGVFSLLVLTVAAVGIHGVVAFAVSQRTREIGIRMALGARAWSVVRIVVMENLGFIALGVAAGLVLALLLARGMTRFLYGVGSADAVTLAATLAVVLAVGIIASLLPARRAVRIDPLVALRAEG